MCCSHHASRERGARCATSHRPYGFNLAEHHHYPGDSFSGGLGVRRPLRFLAWKLELSEAQVTELAAVLNDLKTERAQAAVDDRRAMALLAEAAQGETFERAKAEDATRLRRESTDRLQKQVLESLQRMHALLEPEQRTRLAYLLRTGTLLM